MVIPLPTNAEFTIAIDYWEQCGPYWSGSRPFKRGIWVTSVTQIYQEVIQQDNWVFLRAENC
jgi:hypothetical protein